MIPRQPQPAISAQHKLCCFHKIHRFTVCDQTTNSCTNAMSTSLLAFRAALDNLSAHACVSSNALEKLQHVWLLRAQQQLSHSERDKQQIGHKTLGASKRLSATTWVSFKKKSIIVNLSSAVAHSLTTSKNLPESHNMSKCNPFLQTRTSITRILRLQKPFHRLGTTW